LRKENDDWMQELPHIKYKEDHEKRIKIIGKDELRLRGIESPDVSDALAMTFAPIRRVHMEIWNRYNQDPGQKPKFYYPDLGI
jgi:hypothetical protein